MAYEISRTQVAYAVETIVRYLIPQSALPRPHRLLVDLLEAKGSKEIHEDASELLFITGFACSVKHIHSVLVSGLRRRSSTAYGTRSTLKVDSI